MTSKDKLYNVLDKWGWSFGEDIAQERYGVPVEDLNEQDAEELYWHIAGIQFKDNYENVWEKTLYDPYHDVRSEIEYDLNK